MAWASPASGAEFSVGELVTAAKMNSKITDNLRYLKGLDGAITLDDALIIGASGTAKTLWLFGNADGTANGPLMVKNTSAGTIGVAITLDASGATGGRKFSFLSTANGASLVGGFAVYDSTAAVYRMAIDQNGKVGFGTLTPQGRIHTYDTISGFLKWEFDALAGTAQTVIPDGAGDVLYGLTYWAIVRGSGGAVVPSTNSAGTAIAPGGTANITVGADTVQVQVAANGAVTVQRTAGSQTHKVSLICQWL